MNDLLLRALRCEKTKRPPVWFKRQAGRFLPQYRQLRKEHSLGSLFRTPELAAAITRMPCELLGVDAAILFSDILMILEPLGYRADYPQEGGIVVEETKSKRSVAISLEYVFRAIELVKPTLDVPLIGFCGGPYTVGTYLKKTDSATLQKITDLSIEYLQLQIQAGVDAVKIFDSWAGHLGREDFLTLSLPYLQQIVSAISEVPVIVFCRGSCRYITELVSLGAACIAFDWEKEMATLRQAVPLSIAVQGNLDPEVFKGPISVLDKHVETILQSMQAFPGYIFDLGHGVLPDTPVENARFVVEKIKAIA